MSSYTGAVRPVSAHMGRRRPGTATATRRAPLYDYPQRPKSQARGRSKENTTPDTEGGILNPGENDDPHSAAWAAQKIASTTSGGSLRDYQFGATLGKGTFGKVKLGKHLLTGEPVAIKILEKSRIKEIADVERVTREIKILKKARHDNVIQLFEVIDSTSQIFLVMEYLDGGELFDYIVRKKRLTEQEARHFFRDIMDGLKYLHDLGVVHRDLKPENLLLQPKRDGSHKVKIIDFGLSNLKDEGPSSVFKTACGSPCYASPEMITGRKYYGSKSDMWSAGVVLFAMIAGYLPFEDKNTAALYDKILHCRYRIPEWVSPAGKDLLTKILRTDPSKRCSTTDVLQHPWLRQAVPSTLDAKKNGPTSRNEMHDDVIHRCLQLGLSEKELVDSVVRNAHNRETTSYFLIAERMEKMGVISQKMKKAAGNNKGDAGAASPDSQQRRAPNAHAVHGRQTSEDRKATKRAASASPRPRVHGQGDLERTNSGSRRSGNFNVFEKGSVNRGENQNQRDKLLTNATRQAVYVSPSKTRSQSRQRNSNSPAESRGSDGDGDGDTMEVQQDAASKRPVVVDKQAKNTVHSHTTATEEGNWSFSMSNFVEKLERMRMQSTETTEHSHDNHRIDQAQYGDNNTNDTQDELIRWKNKLSKQSNIHVSISASTGTSGSGSNAQSGVETSHKGTSVFRTYEDVPDQRKPESQTKQNVENHVILPQFSNAREERATDSRDEQGIQRRNTVFDNETEGREGNQQSGGGNSTTQNQSYAVPARPSDRAEPEMHPRPPRSQPPVVPQMKFGGRKVVSVISEESTESTCFEDRDSDDVTTEEPSQDESGESNGRAFTQRKQKKNKPKRRGRSKGIRFRPSSARQYPHTSATDSPRTSRSEQVPGKEGSSQGTRIRQRGRQFRVHEASTQAYQIKRPSSPSGPVPYHTAFETLQRVYRGHTNRRPKSANAYRRSKPKTKDPEQNSDAVSSTDNLASDPHAIPPNRNSGGSETGNQPSRIPPGQQSRENHSAAQNVMIPIFASISPNDCHQITLSIGSHGYSTRSGPSPDDGSLKITPGFKDSYSGVSGKSPRFSPRPRVGIARNTMRPNTAGYLRPQTAGGGTTSSRSRDDY